MFHLSIIQSKVGYLIPQHHCFIHWPYSRVSIHVSWCISIQITLLISSTLGMLKVFVNLLEKNNSFEFNSSGLSVIAVQVILASEQNHSFQYNCRVSLSIILVLGVLLFIDLCNSPLNYFSRKLGILLFYQTFQTALHKLH